MVIEGEEERSSEGFETCVESHSEWFEGTDIILISNTTWIGEELVSKWCLYCGVAYICILLPLNSGFLFCFCFAFYFN